MFKRPTVTSIPEAAIAKWSGDILSEGFVPFPKKLLRTLGQTFNEPAYERLQVVLAIVDYIRPSLTNPPSVEYVAFVAGLTPERCRVVLNDLKNAGLIEYDGKETGLAIGLDGLKGRIRRLSEEPQVN